ncbi:MAG: O-antigen ligase family protein [bacterium]|nr:O-antigen ligase family protein [bacterium]
MDRSRPAFKPEILLRWITVLMIPFISGGPVPWLTGVFSLLVALAFLLRIREVGRGARVEIRFTPLWVPFALVLVLGVVHLVISPVPYSSLLFITHLSLAWVLYLLLLDGKHGDPFLPVPAWTGALIVWMAVGKFFPGLSTPAGPFSNPNYLATVLLTCMAWSLGSLMTAVPEKRRRTVLVIAALASTAGLAVIGSRSAGLAIVALWGLFLIFGKGRVRFAAVAVVVLLFLVPTTLKHRVTEEYRKDPHAFSRILIWEGALRVGLDHPVMGVGPGLYYEYAPRYAFPTDSLPVRYGRIARKPHNEYLRAWAEGGLWGAVVIFGFLLVTTRLFIAAWPRGRPGPALAAAVFLYQALFHDLNEVFALTALGAFWLAQLSGEEGGTLEVRGARGKRFLILSGVMTLLMALWLNLDMSARIMWMKGQRLMAADSGEAVQVLGRAHTLNPLLPGAARDLAGARLAAYQAAGTLKELKIAEAAIHRAQRLNRLDSVPLRMEADLLVERSDQEPEKSRVYLTAAREKLMEALELEPFNALIMLRLSEVYRDMGESEKALETVERSLAMEPNYLEAHRMLIAILRELRLENALDAQRAFDRARDRVEDYRPMSAYEEIVIGTVSSSLHRNRN